MKKETDIPILIADYGRSGQGWLSYMLCYILNARYIEPYCLLRGIIYSGSKDIIKLTQGNLKDRKPTKYSMVVKTHNYPDPFFSLTDKVILLARDPRDVAVSAHARYNVMNNTGTDVEAGAQKEILIKKTFKIKNKLRHQIQRWLMTNKSYSYFVTAYLWKKYYEVWENIDICFKVTYEDLSLHPKKTLKNIMEYLEIEVQDEFIEEAIEKFSFENIAKRRKGIEEKDNVAFRKGIVGDYKNKFNRYNLIIFNKICRKVAEKWGYLMNV